MEEPKKIALALQNAAGFGFEAKVYEPAGLLFEAGEVFRGPELEFNPMTKYFYTDRSVPKKKLTEAEMLQFNDLYRVIGRIDTQLDDLLDPVPPWDGIHRKLTAHKPAVVAIAAGLLLMLVWLRRRRAEA